MSINSKNGLMPSNTSMGLGTNSLTPAKQKDGSGKLQNYHNYATVSINENNDVLSSTTDKRTTDDRMEHSYRMKKKTDTHREIQERKALQKIEEKLEREYKFYQVKTSPNDYNQEKVPEMLLREATDDTIKKLAGMMPAYSSVLFKIRDCYSNCIKTAVGENESKVKEMKKTRKDNDRLRKTMHDLENEWQVKENHIQEANKQVSKVCGEEVPRHYCVDALMGDWSKS